MRFPSKTRRELVVIVDDDADVLRSLQFAFEIEGFEVVAFANGEALLERPPIEDVGCLVVDYRLGGMDGLTLLEQLRERGGRDPAIMITTPTADIVARAARAGVGLVAKPLLCDTLVSEVRRLIGSRTR